MLVGLRAAGPVIGGQEQDPRLAGLANSAGTGWGDFGREPRR
jgi:hypothetical protein